MKRLGASPLLPLALLLFMLLPLLDLTNGAATGTTPAPKPVSCYICDSRDGPNCDYNPHSEQRLKPPQQCPGHAKGCFMLYEEDATTGKTTWVRRDCWYEGDLHCTKGTFNGTCPKRKRDGVCKPRQLIEKGKRVEWNGNRTFLSQTDYDKFRDCVKNISLVHNVTTKLPELPEFGDSKTFRYLFCTGKGACNGKGTPNFTDKPTPPKPTTAPEPAGRSGSSGGEEGGDPCQPLEDQEDPDCICVDCETQAQKDFHYVMWILLFLSIVAALGIGIFAAFRVKKRIQRKSAMAEQLRLSQSGPGGEPPAPESMPLALESGLLPESNQDTSQPEGSETKPDEAAP